MTTVATAVVVSPHSPVIERRPRSSSFGTSTPTFSSDLAKLKGATNSTIVHSYAEAIAIASSFDVLGPNSPLNRKVALSNESDWIDFITKANAVVTDGGGVAINLDKLLRYCFDIAYKMPPSPSTKHVRTSTTLGVGVPPLYSS